MCVCVCVCVCPGVHLGGKQPKRERSYRPALTFERWEMQEVANTGPSWEWHLMSWRKVNIDGMMPLVSPIPRTQAHCDPQYILVE